MVLMRNESTWYNTSNSFGKIINKFQNGNIKKRILEMKIKKLQNNLILSKSNLFKWKDAA